MRNPPYRIADWYLYLVDVNDERDRWRIQGRKEMEITVAKIRSRHGLEAGAPLPAFLVVRYHHILPR